MKKEEKKGIVNVPIIIISVLIGITIIFGVYVFFALHGPDYTKIYLNRILEGSIKNPISKYTQDNTSIEDFLENTAESVLEELEIEAIKYFLIQFKFYNLHEIPLTKNTPKIEIYLNDRVYNAEVIKGEIYVKRGEIEEKDIILRTTIEEVSKIASDEKTFEESLNSGNSRIEIVSDKTALFLKGYANLLKNYPELYSQLS